ncbi:MAG: type IX secretion system sortase PorU [Bacteroidetes bacterium]|nr:type IX secretion system sortase PorU [Bacteroidota bacterium]
MRRLYSVIQVFLFLYAADLAAQNRHVDLNTEPLIYQDNQNFQIAWHNESISLSTIADSVKVSVRNVISVPFEKKGIDLKTLPNSFQWKSEKGVSAKKTVVSVLIFPLFKNENGDIQIVKSFDYDIEIVSVSKPKSNVQFYSTNQSVLASGNWYKWGVAEKGVYKLDYSAIKNTGIDVNEISKLENIKLHGRGGKMLPYPNSESRYDDLPELAVQRVDNGNGFFDNGDYLLFYAEGPHLWNFDTLSGKYSHDYNIYSDSVYYFMTLNSDSPKSFVSQSESALPQNKFVTSFDEHIFHEKDEINLLLSGRLWLGNHFQGSGNQSFQFVLPDLVPFSTIDIKAQLFAKSSDANGSNFIITANDSISPPINIARITGNSTDDIAKSKTSTMSIIANNDSVIIDVQLLAPDVFTEGWINYIELSGRRKLQYNGSPFFFRDHSILGNGNVAHYKISKATSALSLWEITNFTSPKEQINSFSDDSIVFNVAADSLREFVLFDPQKAAAPNYIGKINNQNLHALDPADLIIVAHTSFWSEAKRLADFHQNIDSLSVHLVDIQQIYNEFSGGIEDIVAVRDFMKMLYDKASGPSDAPRYLLLFGDGTYDYKNILKGSTNFVPTYQSVNSTKSTASYTSDDFFGLLDNNEGNWGNFDGDLLDIGIGRFPVTSKEQAKILVDKVLAYSNYFDASNSSYQKQQKEVYAPWRNEVLFMADDEDYNIHLNQANQLATKVENEQPQYNVDKIYIDAFQQTQTSEGDRYPDAKEAIKNKINEGVFLVNYTGHGGEDGLTSEGVFETSDIIGLKNGIKMPLFVTATCEFSRYDLTDRTSAGELLFLNPHGGAIALLSTVRLVFSTPNFNLNKTFYNVAFSQPAGYQTRLGDMFKATKVINNGGINDRNFTLLGDPALRMAFPKHEIILNKVMSSYDNTATDTIRALMKVKMEGSITDTAGNKLTWFNGSIYPKILDKAVDYNTLVNDAPGSAYPFTLQQNLIFKGNATVKQGDFSFEFMVPKDIAAAFGAGKISLYAENGNGIDAQGYNKSITIGGAFDKASADSDGPEVNVYMNDSSFITGGLTSASPLLIVNVCDSSGINLTKGSVGHEMSAILDNSTSQVIDLTSHYQPALNSYQKGTIQYQLEDLSEGKHSIEAKVWDSYNNSSRGYTEFIVSTNANTALEHVLNYPNPFTSKTGFYFEHNQIGKNLEVTVQIFTVSGKLIKTITEGIYADSKRVGPIDWDGLDDFGDAIGRGVYVYKIKVKSDNGTSDNVFEKLVILK